MDYTQLVNAAGYSGPQAEYLARKMQQATVTEKTLGSLSVVFGRAEMAGIDLYEASQRLTAVTAVDATEAAKTLAEESGVSLAKVKGTGKGGRVTKGDVEAAVSED